MVCEQAVTVRVRVHGADDGLVSAQRVRYALHDSGRRGVCQAEPVALRVPLLVLSTGRGGVRLQVSEDKTSTGGMLTWAEQRVGCPNSPRRRLHHHPLKCLCKCALMLQRQRQHVLRVSMIPCAPLSLCSC